VKLLAEERRRAPPPYLAIVPGALYFAIPNRVFGEKERERVRRRVRVRVRKSDKEVARWRRRIGRRERQNH